MTQIEKNKIFLDRLMDALGEKSPKGLSIELGISQGSLYGYSKGQPFGAEFFCKVSERLDISVKRIKEWMPS